MTDTETNSEWTAKTAILSKDHQGAHRAQGSCPKINYKGGKKTHFKCDVLLFTFWWCFCLWKIAPKILRKGIVSFLIDNTIKRHVVYYLNNLKLHIQHRNSKTKHKESTQPKSLLSFIFPFCSPKGVSRKNKFNSKQSYGRIFLWNDVNTDLFSF